MKKDEGDVQRILSTLQTWGSPFNVSDSLMNFSTGKHVVQCQRYISARKYFK